MGTSYGQDIDMHYAANKRRGSPTHAPIPASYASAEQQLMLHRYSPGRNGATSTSSDILRTSWFGMCRCSHTLRRVGVLFSTRVRPHNHMVAALDWYSRRIHCSTPRSNHSCQRTSPNDILSFRRQIPTARQASLQNSIMSKPQCKSPFPCICLSIYRLGPNAHRKIQTWASMLLNSTSSTTTRGRTDSRSVVQPHCW
jgi:hypothetical protein